MDSSQKGIGAVLLQKGKPVLYASKSLTDAETRYANIERKLLAVVYVCERFHTYIYGKPFTVESDHKPLSIIQLKNLKAAPPRLHHMLLRLQGYDITIEYWTRKEMSLPDSLSRVSGQDKQPITLDVSVNLVQFAPRRLEQLWDETRRDSVLCELIEVIIVGWPDSFKKLLSPLRPYWSVRDQLSVEDGLVLLGERLVIPMSSQDYFLQKLHDGHQGSTKKNKLRAKSCVFFPNLNQQIESMVNGCSVCQEEKPSQQKEPLFPHAVPNRPWHTLGTDMFHWNEMEHLLLVDYHSKFIFVRTIHGPATSSKVAANMEFRENRIGKRPTVRRHSISSFSASLGNPACH